MVNYPILHPKSDILIVYTKPKGNHGDKQTHGLFVLVIKKIHAKQECHPDYSLMG